MVDPKSGQSSGVATGRVTIDTSGFTRAREIVVSASRAMAQAPQAIVNSTRIVASAVSSSLSSVANSFRQAEAAAKAFAASDLGTIQRGVSGLSQSFAGVSIAAAAFNTVGITQAQRLQRINGLFVVLSQSEQLAQQRLEQLRQTAERTGQPFLDLAESALAILPAVGRANVDLEQTVSIIQRLAVLDPAQGVEGAAFAVRELLGGTATSLVARFELSRNQINALLAEAGDDPAAIIAGLDALVNNLGLTQEAFDTLSRSGANAFNRLRGAVDEAFATAFTPVLNETIIPLVEEFTRFIQRLNETNPELLQVAATASIVVAALAPLGFALSQIIGAFGALRAAAAFVGTGRIGVGLAAFGGVQLGLAGAQALADSGVRSGDLGRVADGEDPGAILSERLNQIIVIVVDALIEIARQITIGGAFVFNAFENVGASLTVGVSIIQIGFGKIEEAFGGVLIGIADALGGLFDTTALRQAGGELTNLGQQRQLEAAQAALDASAQIATGFEQKVSDINDAFEEARRTILGGLVNFLFPEQRAEEVDQERAAQGIDLQNNALIQALGGLVSSLEQIQPELASIQREFAAESRRIAASRGLQDQRESLDFDRTRGREVFDFRRQQARADQDQLAREREQIARIADIQGEANREQIQQLLDFNRESQRLAEDHERRLIDIQRSTDIAIEDAIAEGNGTAAQRAVRDGEERLNAETEQYSIQRQRREEDFQLQLDSLRAQTSARQQAAIQELELSRQQYAAQRTLQEEEFQLRLAREDEDRAIRLARQAEDRAIEDAARAERLQAQQAEIVAQANLLQQGLEVSRSFWQGTVDLASQAAQSIFNAFNQQQALTARSAGAAAGRAVSNAVNSIGGLLGFAGGGEPPVGQPVRVGEFGPETAVFTSPVRIYPNGAQPASGGVAGTGISIGNIDLSGWVVPAGMDAREIAEEVETRIVNNLAARLRQQNMQRGSL
jgi:hypothetical protein